MNAQPALFLITNCTASKRNCGGQKLSCGDFAGKPERKFEQWWRACRSAKPTMPAIELYKGGAWRHARRAFEAFLGKEKTTEFWVVSAGLGLIPCDLPIPEYSATFAFGDPDSVGGSTEGNREWWDWLSTKRAGEGGVGSIKQLVERHPNSRFLIGLSAAYLRALLPDLLEAKNRLSNPDHLIVVCAGAGKVPELGASLLPIDARFENKFEGTRTSLNARMLAHIAESFPTDGLRASGVGALLSIEAGGLQPPRKYDRAKLADDAIMEIIQRYIKADPPLSASQLLKKLRDSGLACEQKRFGRLFRNTMTSPKR
jgi:hypothetical protein